MDYEKLHKDTIAKLQEMVNSGKITVEIASGICADFIPESEDERTRKALMQNLKERFGTKGNMGKGLNMPDVLAWLEKQGKKDPVDKSEPKFKVGDWIVTNKNHIWYVDESPQTTSYLYRLINQYGKVEVAEFEVVDNVARLWTIQDAKDGDVLACESGWTCIFRALDNHTNTFSSYCFMDSDKWFCNTGCTCHTLDEQFIRAYNFKLHPATREQRDLLFQKMHEACYVWDAEKKELKKIEQKSADSKIIDLDELVIELEETIGTSPHSRETIKDFFQKAVQKYMKCLQIANGEIGRLMDENYYLKEQKPAWSEEDEHYLKDTLTLLEGNRSIHTYGEVEKWLKFLKERYSWKPSEKLMR